MKLFSTSFFLIGTVGIAIPSGVGALSGDVSSALVLRDTERELEEVPLPQNVTMDIHSVALGDAKNRRDIVDDPDWDLFVSFRYGTGDKERHHETVSMDYFSDITNVPEDYFSDIVGMAYIDTYMIRHLDGEDPQRLYCRIVQRRRPQGFLGKMLWPDAGRERVLATAEFRPEDLKLGPDEDKRDIQVPWRMPDGRSCEDRYIKISLVRSRKRPVDNPAYEDQKHKKPEIFFQLIGNLLFRSSKPKAGLRSFDMPKPIQPANPDLNMIQPVAEIENFYFPDEDELYTHDNEQVKARNKAQVILKLPRERDQITHYKNRGEAIHGVRHIVRNFLDTPEEGRWLEDPTSDASMRRIFFSSLGMVFIQKNKGFRNRGFVADLTDMSNYVIKDLQHEYEKFGCKTYFDEQGHVLKIEDSSGEIYMPGDEHWEWAKLLSRSAVFMKAAFIHVGKLHYMWGSQPASALRMYLSPDHPVRRAFFPHFYKTHDTCLRAAFSLFDRKGVLGRGLSLDYEGGLKKVFFDYIGGFKFETFPDEIKKQNLLDCKFHVGATDGMDLHKILQEYVNDLFNEIYATEEDCRADPELKKAHEYLARLLNVPDHLREYTLANVKAIWGEILFRVTGYHQVIGGVTTYCLDPAVVNVRIQPKDITRSIVAPQESAYTLSVIGRLTKVPEAPKLGDDWKQVLEDPDCQSYATLRQKLNELEKVIDHRNTVRDKNVDYHPKYCAISIAS